MSPVTVSRAGAVAHVKAVDIVRRGARILVGLKRDAEGTTKQIEVVCVEGSQIDLQGVEHTLQIETEQLRLVAVKVEL